MSVFDIPTITRRLLRQELAEEFVGGAAVLKDLEAAGWIRPTRRSHRMTLWDAKLLDRACDRLWTEELPCWRPHPKQIETDLALDVVSNDMPFKPRKITLLERWKTLWLPPPKGIRGRVWQFVVFSCLPYRRSSKRPSDGTINRAISYYPLYGIPD